MPHHWLRSWNAQVKLAAWVWPFGPAFHCRDRKRSSCEQCCKLIVEFDDSLHSQVVPISVRARLDGTLFFLPADFPFFAGTAPVFQCGEAFSYQFPWNRNLHVMGFLPQQHFNALAETYTSANRTQKQFKSLQNFVQWFFNCKWTFF